MKLKFKKKHFLAKRFVGYVKESEIDLNLYKLFEKMQNFGEFQNCSDEIYFFWDQQNQLLNGPLFDVVGKSSDDLVQKTFFDSILYNAIIETSDPFEFLREKKFISLIRELDQIIINFNVNSVYFGLSTSNLGDKLTINLISSSKSKD
jgi:hypothetical protein